MLQRGFEPRRSCRCAACFAAIRSASLRSKTLRVLVSGVLRKRGARGGGARLESESFAPAKIPVQNGRVFLEEEGSSRGRSPPRIRILCASKNTRPKWTGIFTGAPAGIRTPDTLLKRQVLCRLSYWGGEIRWALARCGVAGAAGLEPANGGVKVRCVTASPRPYVVARLTVLCPCRRAAFAVYREKQRDWIFPQSRCLWGG